MSLDIYTDTTVDSKISSGTRTNPLQIALNGRSGDVKEIQLYVRSDSDVLAYTNISVHPVLSTAGKNLITDTEFYWKLKAGSTQPTKAEWDAITVGNTIGITNLSDSGTYIPFWLKVKIPANANTASFTHVSLRIEATET